MHRSTNFTVCFFLLLFLLLNLLLNIVALILFTRFDCICNLLIVIVGVLVLEYLYLVCLILQLSYLVGDPLEAFTFLIKNTVFIIVSFLVDEHSWVGLLFHTHLNDAGPVVFDEPDMVIVEHDPLCRCAVLSSFNVSHLAVYVTRVVQPANVAKLVVYAPHKGEIMVVAEAN